MFCEKTQKVWPGRPSCDPSLLSWVTSLGTPTVVFANVTSRQMKKLINKMATPMLSKITMATRMGAEPCSGRGTGEVSPHPACPPAPQPGAGPLASRAPVTGPGIPSQHRTK